MVIMPQFCLRADVCHKLRLLGYLRQLVVANTTAIHDHNRGGAQQPVGVHTGRACKVVLVDHLVQGCFHLWNGEPRCDFDHTRSVDCFGLIGGSRIGTGKQLQLWRIDSRVAGRSHQFETKCAHCLVRDGVVFFRQIFTRVFCVTTNQDRTPSTRVRPTAHTNKRAKELPPKLRRTLCIRGRHSHLATTTDA